ncbi:NRPS-like enzyme [Pseudozyma hubeiensis SY62]|uniref:Fatty acyl-CoA reductase n=1 Tax=Pseudozyma hubeiensis (strain SY62) TaxID=1305764 RepID=R9NXZ4_PSEHS|nr:NRPS-like enzyme [Pseudozyma hubeiensis SY62]GAC93613.1 NRPS-like enzyme [Pseudozyma hubeiensis SY62]
MSSTRSPSPSGTERSSATDISSDATSIVESMSNLRAEDDSIVRDHTIQDVLKGSRILITGAAGFVGAALLHRLLGDDSFDVKQVVAIVRGKTSEDALKRLPKSVHHHAQPASEGALPKLVIVNGDCARPNFGLNEQDFEKVRKTEIVIHCAGDTRFTLPISKAFESMADLAYFTARFSLLTWNVKTHIHVSTTFVGWYLKNGSLVSESLTPEGCGTQVDEQSEHVNTYFQAKTYAESCVNSLFTSQVGRKLHGKTCRIVRLATLGPAIDFPRDAWGAGHPSSPVCAALAAHVADPNIIFPNAGLDVIPVDIAVNQILAVTASAHALQKLPTTHRLHPKNPAAPTSKHLAEVPCYHVACGRGDEARIPMTLLNDENVKIEEPYIPTTNLLKVYDPFITKIVEFDVARTRTVLGLPALVPDQQRKLSKASISDLPLKQGSLKLDIVKSVQDRFGNDKLQGWTGYLQQVRDQMEAMGPRSDWETFVD